MNDVLAILAIADAFALMVIVSYLRLIERDKRRAWHHRWAILQRTVLDRTERRRVRVVSNQEPLWSGPPEVVSYIPFDGGILDPIRMAIRFGDAVTDEEWGW